MASCLICHRLARGFASPMGQFCSMDCMNSEVPKSAYMPYQDVAMQVDEDIKKPLDKYSLVEARELTHTIIGTWINCCRCNSGLKPIEFVPWHDEKNYVETAMRAAMPDKMIIVKSVVDVFIRECREEIPF